MSSQDQVVLGMLDCFNKIWAREGVMHRLNGGGQTPVRAPLYRCVACGTDRGFVEMLGGAKPVEDLVEKKSRGENGWKSGDEIIPTAVAGFISIWALDLRDRHKGNMVVLETDRGQQFANVRAHLAQWDAILCSITQIAGTVVTGIVY